MRTERRTTLPYKSNTGTPTSETENGLFGSVSTGNQSPAEAHSLEYNKRSRGTGYSSPLDKPLSINSNDLGSSLSLENNQENQANSEPSSNNNKSDIDEHHNSIMRQLDEQINQEFKNFKTTGKTYSPRASQLSSIQNKQISK